MRTINKLFPITITVTIIDWVVINHLHYGGWVYILGGWFLVWLLIFFILERRWLVSIGTVLIVSVIEDALFLLWARIVGTIPWSSQWYCHDWLLLCWNWFELPSNYIIEPLIGIGLILVGKRRD